MLLSKELAKFGEKLKQIEQTKEIVKAVQKSDETLQYLSELLFEIAFDYINQLVESVEKQLQLDFVEIQVYYVLPFILNEIKDSHLQLVVAMTSNNMNTQDLYSIRDRFNDVISQLQLSDNSELDETVAETHFGLIFSHHIKDEEMMVSPLSVDFTSAYERRLLQVFSGKEHLIELYEGIASQNETVLQSALIEYRANLFDLDFLKNNENFHLFTYLANRKNLASQFSKIKEAKFFKALTLVRQIEIACLFNQRDVVLTNLNRARNSLTKQDISYLLKSVISQGGFFFVKKLIELFSDKLDKNEYFSYGASTIDIDFCSWAALFRRSKILSKLLKEGFLPQSTAELLLYIAAGGSTQCFKIIENELSTISDETLQQATLIALSKGNFALYQELTAILTARGITVFDCYFYQPSYSEIFNISPHLNYIFAVYQSGWEPFLKVSEVSIEKICEHFEFVMKRSDVYHQDVHDLFIDFLITAAKTKNEKIIQHAFDVFFEMEKKHPELLRLLASDQLLIYEYLAENIAKRILNLPTANQRAFIKLVSSQGLHEFKHALISIQHNICLEKLKCAFQLVQERLFNLTNEKSKPKDNYKLLASMNLMVAQTSKKQQKKEVEHQEGFVPQLS